MKRPLALIGLTLMAVLTVCFYGDNTVITVVATAAAVGLGISLSVKKLRKSVEAPVLFATILLAISFFTFYSRFFVEPVLQKWSGDTHAMVGVLRDEGEYREGKNIYKLSLIEIDGENANVGLVLYSKDAIFCQVGDCLSFTSETYSVTDGNLADGCYLCASVYDEGEVEISASETHPLYYYAVKLRNSLRSAFYLELDYDTAALANAVLLGDGSGFSSDTVKSFRASGLSHIAVVSGLHLSVIAMLYSKTLGKLIKNKYANALATVAVIALFLALTGFGRSSLRAAIMLIVTILAGIFNRESDSLNSLGLASILLCLVNPLAVGDIGVLLSYGATLGIVALSSPIEAFFTRGLARCRIPLFVDWVLCKAASLLSTTLSAVIATLPITILYFGKASLVQLISNITVVPWVKWFMLASGLAALFHFIPYADFITDFMAAISNFIGGIILKLSKMFASLPCAYMKADYDFVILWMAFTFALFLIAVTLFKRCKGIKLCCLVVSVLILISGSTAHLLYSQNQVTLKVIPAYRGQSVILESSDGNAVLACSGKVSNSSYILNELEPSLSCGSLIVVASCDNSASKNANNILSEFDYERVLLYDTDDNSEYAARLTEQSSQVVEAYGDYTVKLWDKALLKIMLRGGDVYEYLTAGSTTVLILPSRGDASLIPESLRSSDVLITCGMINGMELLSFKTLISNGNAFQRAAVIDFYRFAQGKKLSVSNTVSFDL